MKVWLFWKSDGYPLPLGWQSGQLDRKWRWRLYYSWMTGGSHCLLHKLVFAQYSSTVSPLCKLCEDQIPKNEDIPHILTECMAYSEIRNRIFKDYEELCNNAMIQIKFRDILRNPSQLTQFILDCGSLNLPSRTGYDDGCPIFWVASSSNKWKR